MEGCHGELYGHWRFWHLLERQVRSPETPEYRREFFYLLLRTAVHGGQGQSIAQAMVDDDKLNPVTSRSDLTAYYDTAINRANVVLFDA